jgi:hypothetical protein
MPFGPQLNITYLAGPQILEKWGLNHKRLGTTVLDDTDINKWRVQKMY